MPELSRSPSTPRTKTAEVHIALLAKRQWGVVSRKQLERFGLSEAGIARWVSAGRLHRIHRGVYAVGHRALSDEGQLAAALLLASRGAALSHTTAAWWLQLLRNEPRPIHISAPGRRSSVPAVRLHHPRVLERTHHRGLPITTVPRTLLDIAAMVPFDELRRALAEAEYQRLARVDEISAMLRRGHPGSGRLRLALARHQPRLAHTLSALEERFLALCEANSLPSPEVNATVCGLMVDALWRQQRVTVELDGHAAHASPFAMHRDRDRDLTLRAGGYRVLRYTWQQITEQPEPVAADLRAALSEGSARSSEGA
jgi:very-short-patch-repair endonuclease/predicted transcriptional regulator of viral defense system